MKELPFPFPRNYKQLVTKKPVEGEKSEFEVRFSVYKLRESRSAESRRRWVQGIDKKRAKVWVTVGHGMIQKVSPGRYQFRGMVYSQPRGRRMFEYTLSEAELSSLFDLDNNSYKAEIKGLFTRVKKNVVIHNIGFCFQTREFLKEEVKSLVKDGKTSRPKKWGL